jgi:glycosyltransferase involved in cell wall biosynthesis
MELPELTIIMPVYNGARYMKAAVDSLLAQSFAAFQLIIINDGSTDHTPNIIEQYTDPRILIITHHTNQGIAKCRNLGLKMADTSYIAFFDADDVARNDKFQRQIKFLETNPDYALVGSSVVLTDMKGHKTGRWKLNFSPHRLPVAMLFRNCLVTSTVVFRRNSAKGFVIPEHLVLGEDWWLFWHVLQHGKGRNLQAPLVRYRQHDASLMATNTFTRHTHDHHVWISILESIGITTSAEMTKLLYHLKLNQAMDVSPTVSQYKTLFLQLAKGVARYGQHPRRHTLPVFLNRWMKVVALSFRHPGTFVTALFSPGFLVRLFHSLKTRSQIQ